MFKISLFKIIIAFVILSYDICSQPNCLSCKNENYPYIGCCESPIGISSCARCTNDPTNISEFRPLKKCLENFQITSIKYNHNNFPYPLGLFSDSAMTIPIITEAGIRNDIEDALGAWLEACDNGNEINNSNCDDCELIISWGTTKADMYGWDDALGVHHKEFIPGTCNVDCQNTKIMINGTEHFRGKGPLPDERHFFYTNKYNPNKDDYKYFHFKSMIMHEIGHWLGLGDIYNDEGICVPPPSGSNKLNTVMFGLLDDCVERDTLSDIDKCMFMLLYCCDPTSDIKDLDSSHNFNTKPNPATDYITINLGSNNRRVDPTVEGAMSIEIYDVMGMKIQSTKVEAIHELSFQKVDVSNLTPGVYFIKIGDRVEKFIKI
ncbi:MAG TPA: T9SS type A sorting domain-containing protein [Candidatus Kapabacteria bacterium]|nr:T9SS type A sorting domain-containing protein [Candidatus Kapabacteria bacterium]